jgi:SsrA-binding protein
LQIERKPGTKTIVTNRKAFHRFTVIESLEAGLVLQGHEVKSLRQGQASLEEGIIRIDRGEIFLLNVHIPPYAHLSHVHYDPTRTRKLLLHRSEINRLSGQTQLKGLTLIPLELYFKDGKAKVLVALAKGKKLQDRREEIKKRDADRMIRRGFAPRA